MTKALISSKETMKNDLRSIKIDDKLFLIFKVKFKFSTFDPIFLVKETTSSF